MYHADYFLIEFIICMNYGTTPKLAFNKNGVAKNMSFYNFCFVNYAGANQCMDLKQTRKQIEEMSCKWGQVWYQNNFQSFLSKCFKFSIMCYSFGDMRLQKVS